MTREHEPSRGLPTCDRANALRQLIVCSLEEWDEVWRRNQHLASGLLRRNPLLRILYIEPPADPIHDLRLGRSPRPLRIRRVGSHPRIVAVRPLKPAPRRAGPLADMSLQLQVRVAARVLRFDRPILWLNDVTYAHLIRSTGWPCVYDVTDDWLLADGSHREIARLEKLEALALRDAAEVVVCSPALAVTRGAFRPVELIPNAADVEHFRRPAPRPDDLPAAPVAVYVGSLHDSRFDTGLVVALARAEPELEIVLIGPDSLSETSRSALGAEPNVQLLGARPYAAVPGYLQHANVILAPHLVNAFTESLDPIKAYEFLAVGRPVVATPVAGFRELGPSAVTAAPPGFPAAVRRALAAAESPMEPASIPTWDERVDAFAAVLARVVQ